MISLKNKCIFVRCQLTDVTLNQINNSALIPDTDHIPYARLYQIDENILETKYAVMEHFYTVQGEGVHTGNAAYFIRLAGCDVGCSWCDVKESWDAEQHPMVTVREMLENLLETPVSIVVITGGEPLLQNLEPLCNALHALDMKIHIETSGSSPLSGALDWVTLSPKRFKPPLEEIYPYVDELKVVVLRKKDLSWAEEHAAKCPGKAHLLLQPEWDTPESMPLIVEFVKANPEWGISLQTHKFLGVP